MGRALVGMLFLGQVRLYQVVFHTHGWLDTLVAVAIAAASTIVLGVAGWAARDTWPLAVPYDFKTSLDAYKTSGWRTARVHPWWRCKLARDKPHVHIVMPRKTRQASRLVLVSDDTAIRLPRSGTRHMRLTKDDKAPDGVLAQEE